MVNLDCMSFDELIEFWSSKIPKKGEKDNHEKMLIRRYAFNKAIAVDNREKGNIETALFYEKICDKIYEKLPEREKW